MAIGAVTKILFFGHSTGLVDIFLFTKNKLENYVTTKNHDLADNEIVSM